MRRVLFILMIIMIASATASAGDKAPERCGGAATVGSIRTVPLRRDFTDREIQELETLEIELKKAGVDASMLNEIFSSPLLALYDSGVQLAKHNPENKADKGKKSYNWYRECLGADKRITDGKVFMKKESAALAGAQARYGVDKRFIVSILGVESSFSENIGKFNAVNALVTQYVLVKGRKGYALKQLKELIGYSKTTGRDVLGFTSSYAGAIGCAQFIPASLNNYFVGKEGNVASADPYDIGDCIYSVAYYLKRSRWDHRENGKPPIKGSRNWKAIHAYNHSDSYTKLIIDMATSL